MKEVDRVLDSRLGTSPPVVLSLDSTDSGSVWIMTVSFPSQDIEFSVTFYEEEEALEYVEKVRRLEDFGGELRVRARGGVAAPHSLVVGCERITPVQGWLNFLLPMNIIRINPAPASAS